MSFFRGQVQQFLGKFGYRLAGDFTAHFLKANRVDLVLDVGANEGQFASRIRSFGYRGRIVSFEPIASARKVLDQHASKESQWKVEPYALGSTTETRTMFRSFNTESSSLLPILPTLTDAAKDARTVGSEEIHIRRLDDIFADHYQAGESVFIKIDTQGFEREVLAGAEQSLQAIQGVQIEASLTPCYEGELLLEDTLRYLQSRGFTLIDIMQGYRHPLSRRLLQCDFIFWREAALAPQFFPGDAKARRK